MDSFTGISLTLIGSDYHFFISYTGTVEIFTFSWCFRSFFNHPFVYIFSDFLEIEQVEDLIAEILL